MNKELGEIYNNLMLYKSKEDLALNIMELTANIMVLENNWNELKEWLKEIQQEEFDINGHKGICDEIRIDCLLDKMQELESRK